MDTVQSVRALLEAYLDGQIGIDDASVQLAPLVLGISSVSLEDVANGSLSIEGRERVRALFARLQGTQTHFPLHVRRLSVHESSLPALGSSLGTAILQVDVYALDAQREHSAQFVVKSERVMGGVLTPQQQWRWESSVLLLAAWSAALVNDALSDANSRLTNESWSLFLQGIHRLFGVWPVSGGASDA